MQSYNTFGIAGCMFSNARSGKFLGFSKSATKLTIAGGLEVVPVMNSAGLDVQAFQMPTEGTVSIEGVTDAHAGLVAALRGGTLVSGTDSVNTALRVQFVEPASLWGATSITVAAGVEPGVYTVQQDVDTSGVTDVITYETRLVLSTKAPRTLGGDYEDAEDVTTGFTFADVPDEVEDGDQGFFIVEDITADQAAAYVYGSTNIPEEMSIACVTTKDFASDPDNVNVMRILIPRVVFKPVEVTAESGVVNALGTIEGRMMHSQSIDGTHLIQHSFGI